MTIFLRLFGELKQYAPEELPCGRAGPLELPEGTTVLQLVLRLGIPYGGEEGLLVAAVNDTEVTHQTRLQHGDKLSLFEPLAGG